MAIDVGANAVETPAIGAVVEANGRGGGKALRTVMHRRGKMQPFEDQTTAERYDAELAELLARQPDPRPLVQWPSWASPDSPSGEVLFTRLSNSSQPLPTSE